MKNGIRLTAFTIVTLFLFSISLQAQLLQGSITSDSSEVIKVKDTVCFKFNFVPGDTLIYKVDSADSIIVDLNPALVRNRVEYLEIIPMKAKTKGHVMLRLRYYSFLADETVMDKPDSSMRRTTSPWLNRIVYLETDSMGTRYSISYADSSNAAMAVGGAFQPYIIFPIKESCKAVNESWLVSGTDLLAENSCPPAALRYSSLMRAEEPKDTLGEHCNTFRFVKTGQGTFYYAGTQDTIHITNIINSSGRMEISEEKLVPVHYFTNIEEKITIYQADGSTMPAWHYTAADFTLERYLPKQDGNEKANDRRQPQQQKQQRRR